MINRRISGTDQMQQGRLNAHHYTTLHLTCPIVAFTLSGDLAPTFVALIGIRADSVEDIANTPYTKLGVPIRAEAVDVAHRKHLLKP